MWEKLISEKQKNGINMHCNIQKQSSEKNKFVSSPPYPIVNTHPKKASLISNGVDSNIK